MLKYRNELLMQMLTTAQMELEKFEIEREYQLDATDIRLQDVPQPYPTAVSRVHSQSGQQRSLY